MKRNPLYTLCKIDTAYYLLPHGQGIADHNRGIQINEAGVFLWNALPESRDQDSLLKKFLEHYEAEESDIPILKQDLDNFLFLLDSLGILVCDWEQPVSEDAPSLYLQIGTLCLRLIGPKEAFAEEFYAFQTSPQPADLTIELRTEGFALPGNGTLLVENDELHIWEYEEHYRLLFPASPKLSEAWLSKSGTYACIYHHPACDEELAFQLFHSIRLLYLYTAQRHGCYALHSASILYREKAWLFSGHSGMGKSTHAGLWHTLLNTPLLNGDLNLLSLSGEKPIIYGIPWCGTSGISTTKTYPLGGIFLLSRSSQDACVELSRDQKALLIMQRLVSPGWTAEMLRKNLEFTQRLTEHIAVCQLECTKEPSAAYTMKEWIDAYLSK